MTRLVVAAVAAGAIGLLPNPTPADAQSKLDRCTIEAVRSCDNDFPGADTETVAIRGYCYMIRTAWCLIFD